MWCNTSMKSNGYFSSRTVTIQTLIVIIFSAMIKFSEKAVLFVQSVYSLSMSRMSLLLGVLIGRELLLEHGCLF